LVALVAACAHVGPAQEIPFVFERNQILVTARIEQRGSFGCLVDTGANPSVIDLALARSFELRLSEQAGTAEGIGDEHVKVYATEMNAGVGDAAGSRFAAVAVDLAPLSKTFGRPIDCILGQSWLATRVVEFDYPRRVLRLGASRRSAGDCHTMPMRFWMDDDLMPLVTIQVNGRDVPVSLDTGSSTTLRLFPLEARAAGIEFDLAGDTSVTGVRGKATTSAARAARIQFGPLSATDTRISVGARNEGEAPGRSGNLGNGLLRLGVLTLDYPARSVRICTP
jgi:hypothetical protein